MTQKWFSLKETAEYFGVCEETLRSWRHEGLIPREAILEIGQRPIRKYDIAAIEEHHRKTRRRGRPSTPVLITNP